MANDVKFEGKDRRLPGIEKFLADNRDAIIEMAANAIAEKTIRSKAFKEAWKSKMEEARG